MGKVVVILDFKLGNLHSVVKACDTCNITAVISSNPAEVEKADGLILPGVGAYGEAMSNLKDLQLVDTIRNFAGSGKPLFGICIGLQLLLSSSSEFGFTEGLNLIPGKVNKLQFKDTEKYKSFRVPFIGWNKINIVKESSIYSGLRNESFYYFVHSFSADLDDDKYLSSFSIYGDRKVTSSIEKDNIFATQFHPEKSGQEGLKIYKNWATKFNLNE